MLHIYLPVAGQTENVLLLLGMGAGIGVLSGLFGVGGGFLLTPLLIFLGIPPAIAVGSGANQVLGASVSAVIVHWRRKTVDVRMASVLFVGGLFGSTVGVALFSWLKSLGQVDLAVNLCYLTLLTVIGGVMLFESLSALIRRNSPRSVRRKLHSHGLLHRLPLKVRFPRSRLYISVIPPAVIGFLVGAMSAVMGVGGGFLMIPAMIYLLQMPAEVVIGTSLLNIVFVTANVTFMQATANQSVDVVLSAMLLIGGVIGAQYGARLGRRLRSEQLRFMLALLVAGVAVKLALDLGMQPKELYGLAIPPSQ